LDVAEVDDQAVLFSLSAQTSSGPTFLVPGMSRLSRTWASLILLWSLVAVLWARRTAGRPVETAAHVVEFL
jgi:hypothetical protein